MSIAGLLLVIFLILFLFGGLGGGTVIPFWQHGYGYGNNSNAVIALFLVIALLFLLRGYI